MWWTFAKDSSIIYAYTSDRKGFSICPQNWMIFNEQNVWGRGQKISNFCLSLIWMTPKNKTSPFPSLLHFAASSDLLQIGCSFWVKKKGVKVYAFYMHTVSFLRKLHTEYFLFWDCWLEHFYDKKVNRNKGGTGARSPSIFWKMSSCAQIIPVPLGSCPPNTWNILMFLHISFATEPTFWPAKMSRAFALKKTSQFWAFTKCYPDIILA